MNLSDEQQLRLTTLCSALADDTLSQAGRDELNAMLLDSEEARKFYIRHAALSASLGEYAAELQSDAPVPVRKAMPRVVVWAAAAAVAIAGVAMALLHFRSSPSEIASRTSEPPSQTVALLSGTQGCEWNTPALQPGASLQAGQRLELKSGFAEVTFDSGATVTLEGPAALVITSPWDASLESGTATANVPEEAEGFRLNHDTIELVNSTAELAMTADESGTDVLVQKGSVAASSQATSAPVTLRENESRRFNAAGVSDVSDLDRKRARFARVLKFDRPAASGGYLHWTFDDASTASLAAETKGKKKAAYLARMMKDESATAAASLTDGRWQHALNFDGHLFARAATPGLSLREHATTFTFWARVPVDASPAGGSAMLSIGEHKRGSPHLRIAWNKKRAEGPVGALQTEAGRSVASGTTNLRDGQWHHVAIVCMPTSKDVMQVKQYVDGRLDGSSTGAMSAARGRDKTDEPVEAILLGRGAGSKNREGFFVGAMDELFVVDRALSPSEITSLMKSNQPPDTGLATTF